MRTNSTRFTIRRRLAGLSCEEVGRLLRMTPDRAGELLGERGAFGDLHELRSELRIALNNGPDLRVVYRELKEGALIPGRSGRTVRWTRIILDITLREWTELAGRSTSFWSIFEREEDYAEAAFARGSISEDQIGTISEQMQRAADRLGELFPSAALPLTGSMFDSEPARAAAKKIIETAREGLEELHAAARSHGVEIEGGTE